MESSSICENSDVGNVPLAASGSHALTLASDQSENSLELFQYVNNGDCVDVQHVSSFSTQGPPQGALLYMDYDASTMYAASFDGRSFNFFSMLLFDDGSQASFTNLATITASHGAMAPDQPFAAVTSSNTLKILGLSLEQASVTVVASLDLESTPLCVAFGVHGLVSVGSASRFALYHFDGSHLKLIHHDAGHFSSATPTSIAVSPDEHRIAVGSSTAPYLTVITKQFGEDSYSTAVFDSDDIINPSYPTQSVAFSEDGTFMAVVTSVSFDVYVLYGGQFKLTDATDLIDNPYSYAAFFTDEVLLLASDASVTLLTIGGDTFFIDFSAVVLAALVFIVTCCCWRGMCAGKPGAIRLCLVIAVSTLTILLIMLCVAWIPTNDLVRRFFYDVLFMWLQAFFTVIMLSLLAYLILTGALYNFLYPSFEYGDLLQSIVVIALAVVYTIVVGVPLSLMTIYAFFGTEWWIGLWIAVFFPIDCVCLLALPVFVIIQVIKCDTRLLSKFDWIVEDWLISHFFVGEKTGFYLVTVFETAYRLMIPLTILLLAYSFLCVWIDNFIDDIVIAGNFREECAGLAVSFMTHFALVLVGCPTFFCCCCCMPCLRHAVTAIQANTTMPMIMTKEQADAEIAQLKLKDHIPSIWFHIKQFKKREYDILHTKTTETTYGSGRVERSTSNYTTHHVTWEKTYDSKSNFWYDRVSQTVEDVNLDDYGSRSFVHVAIQPDVELSYPGRKAFEEQYENARDIARYYDEVQQSHYHVHMDGFGTSADSFSPPARRRLIPRNIPALLFGWAMYLSIRISALMSFTIWPCLAGGVFNGLGRNPATIHLREHITTHKEEPATYNSLSDA
ncbi:Snf7 [Carpediemonas membranifera]|uniref:Snf7 n=1 Tax=Carpediemonas membranifera TaxID=201153 RepID=A0A8J6DYG3_9EUKA|nr:Snf7 [Carpediemonas membranifera]|eukprot:KAG9392184.1 Snf7 [Carpediemonas membranifera]